MIVARKVILCSDKKTVSLISIALTSLSNLIGVLFVVKDEIDFYFISLQLTSYDFIMLLTLTMHNSNVC